jgi:hypothetical protein
MAVDLAADVGRCGDTDVDLAGRPRKVARVELT